MGYSNQTDIERIIAQGLTNSSPGDQLGRTRTNLVNIGNTFNSNLVPVDIVNQYIQWADEQINAALSQLYVTPFCQKSDYEAALNADIDVYNDLVSICGYCPFNVGDSIILSDGTNEEYHVIDQVVDDIENNIFSTVDMISFGFEADNTRVVRVKFPEPIKQVSAMLAASRVYDKYYAAQNDPNISEYGKYLRDQAYSMLNDIRTGGSPLHGQTRRGQRFFNPNLSSVHRIPIDDPKMDKPQG